MKKIEIKSEIAYVFAMIVLALAVAVSAESDLGLSMIACPSYLLHLKLKDLSDFFTWGVCEYLVQCVLLIVLCILMKKFKPLYLFVFIANIFYSAILDLWRLIPILNQDMVSPESLNIVVRIIFYVMGISLTAFAVAIFFRCYLYPQVYDLFMIYLRTRIKASETTIKVAYDISFLVISLIMTFVLFGEIKGIGVGTIFTALFSGLLIGLFGKALDKIFVFKPLFPKLEKKFEL